MKESIPQIQTKKSDGIQMDINFDDKPTPVVEKKDVDIIIEEKEDPGWEYYRRFNENKTNIKKAVVKKRGPLLPPFDHYK